MTKPPTPAGSGTEAAGADPSMEDILASIRRILNEDEPATPPAEPAPNAGGSGGDDGVLVLDEGMLVEAPSHHPVAEPAELVAEHPAPAAAAPAVIPLAAPTPPSAPATPATGLMAPEAEAAAASAVGSLIRTLSSERSTAVHRGGPTIEDLVREELRPLLKTWLDEHLPPLVERLVRSEIERVTGRAGH